MQYFPNNLGELGPAASEIQMGSRVKITPNIEMIRVDQNREVKMSATIAIEIPREIVHVTRMGPQALKRELAVYLFEQGKISFGKARELAEMTVWEFQQLLGYKRIPIHYDLADYEEDLATLRELEQL